MSAGERLIMLYGDVGLLGPGVGVTGVAAAAWPLDNAVPSAGGALRSGSGVAGAGVKGAGTSCADSLPGSLSSVAPSAIGCKYTPAEYWMVIVSTQATKSWMEEGRQGFREVPDSKAGACVDPPQARSPALL